MKYTVWYTVDLMMKCTDCVYLLKQWIPMNKSNEINPAKKH